VPAALAFRAIRSLPAEAVRGIAGETVLEHKAQANPRVKAVSRPTAARPLYPGLEAFAVPEATHRHVQHAVTGAAIRGNLDECQIHAYGSATDVQREQVEVVSAVVGGVLVDASSRFEDGDHHGPGHTSI
jgi:hypothetical protein